MNEKPKTKKFVQNDERKKVKDWQKKCFVIVKKQTASLGHNMLHLTEDIQQYKPISAEHIWVPMYAAGLP